MRVALVIPEWGAVAGGIATYYRYLVPQLREQGHDIQVFVGSAYVMDEVMPEPFVESLQAATYRSHLPRFAHLKPLAGLDRHLAAAWGLRDQVRAAAEKASFDLVECCDWGLGFAPWLGGDTPLLVRLHASLSQIARVEQLPGEAAFQTVTGLLEQAGLGLADALVTYSDANAKFWSEQLGRPVAVNRPAYPTEPQGKTDGAGLVSGKIQLWKGVEVLCQALTQVPGTTLDWYGRDMPTQHQGGSISMSRLMSEKYPEVWGGQIRAQGMIAPRELKARRQDAAFVVVPSSWDVFNFTAVEAMAAGIPLIASSGAGACELIDHGRNGLRFEAGNAQQLAECFSELDALSNQQRLALGRAGRETVACELAVVQRAKEHLGVYEGVRDMPRKPLEIDLWNHLLGAPAGLSGASDLANNLSGRELAGALLERGAQRLRRPS